MTMQSNMYCIMMVHSVHTINTSNSCCDILFNSHGTHHITKATCVLCCSGIEYETISCFDVQLREFVALCQVVTCDLFQLAEVFIIIMRRMK